MADHVAGGGGGHGLGAAMGAGGGDDPPPHDNRSNPPGFQFKDWKNGNVNTSRPAKVSIIDDDAQVIVYLQDSGMVDGSELTLYTVPANYVIQSEAKMIALRSTMNHYNAMAVGRRKYLYLAVKSILGEGSKGDDKLCQKLLDQFLDDKKRVWEYVCEIKPPRPKFSRMPEVFDHLPVAKPEKRVQR
ncbi:uncharacterized protein [Lolium perenne]|uniref:uncharacterized protein isoform X2 n=1 Tax=Lolium perenne TaxID=4522 RepID=UPI0021F5C09C|nr:uncharacterized protein LOC127292572 isoform X2 [Lolium perenne]